MINKICCNSYSTPPEQGQFQKKFFITIATILAITGTILTLQGRVQAPKGKILFISGITCSAASLVAVVASAILYRQSRPQAKETKIDQIQEEEVPADCVNIARQRAQDKSGVEVADIIEAEPDRLQKRAYLEVVTQEQVKGISEAGRARVLATLLPKNSTFSFKRGMPNSEALVYIWHDRNSSDDLISWIWEEGRESQNDLFRCFSFSNGRVRNGMKRDVFNVCLYGNIDDRLHYCMRLVKAYPDFFCNTEEAPRQLFMLEKSTVQSIKMYWQKHPHHLRQLEQAGWINISEQN